MFLDSDLTMEKYAAIGDDSRVIGKMWYNKGEYPSKLIETNLCDKCHRSGKNGRVSDHSPARSHGFVVPVLPR